MRDKERYRYLPKLDSMNSFASLNDFVHDEGNALDFITDKTADIEETITYALMVNKLNTALSLLSDSEQALIQSTFFDGLFEHEVGLNVDISQSIVNKREAKVLTKLRK